MIQHWIISTQSINILYFCVNTTVIIFWSNPFWTSPGDHVGFVVPAVEEIHSLWIDFFRGAGEHTGEPRRQPKERQVSISEIFIWGISHFDRSRVIIVERLKGALGHDDRDGNPFLCCALIKWIRKIKVDRDKLRTLLRNLKEAIEVKAGESGLTRNKIRRETYECVCERKHVRTVNLPPPPQRAAG